MSQRILLSVLIAQTEQSLQKFAVSKKTKTNYRYEGFNQIRRYCERKDILYYDKHVIETFVLASRVQYESHIMGRARFTIIRKVACMLEEYYRTKHLVWSCLSPWSNYRLCEYFENLLKEFCNFLRDYAQISEGSIHNYRSTAYTLLCHVESQLGYTELHSLNLQDIADFLLIIATRRPRSMAHLFDGLRKFGAFLFERKLTSIDLRNALTGTPAKHRKLKAAFTVAEVARILAAPDRSTSLGKRDYTMFLLADKLGIRSGDICNLRFENINWKQREISFTQGKTNIPYSSPLDAAVMNAIADYILHARPNSNLPYIFLREVKPYGKLQRGSLGGRLVKYMDQVSVSHIPGEGKCLHAFRRKFGTTLLNAEIPANEISNALGHTHQDSLWHYIAADVEHLRSCALDLTDVPVTMEALR